MNPGTDYIAHENSVATSDPRFDMRLTEKFDDEDAASTGWTWVAAVLIAGSLIVSGYLDQESRHLEGTTAAAVTGSYASNTSAPQTAVAGANRADHRSVKGY